MKNIIHFFDLDGTLWNIKNNAWIIDKRRPKKPIIKLTSIELSEIIAGIYKYDNNNIEYNSRSYWISDAMFTRIQKKLPSIDMSRVGLSYIEMTNPEYFSNLVFYKENLRHLIGKTNYDLGILSARHNQDDDSLMLKQLNTELDNIGLTIDKFYYISDKYEPKGTNVINYKKTDIIIEHLVGFHINGDHFVPIKQDKYNEVHFYDDEPQNINVAGDIQELIEGYLKNTDDEVFNRIIKNIKDNKPKLYTHLITNNSNNRFKTTEIIVSEPVKFPVKIEEKISYKNINGFNDFINKNHKKDNK